jgi:hypothetical protein
MSRYTAKRIIYVIIGCLVIFVSAGLGKYIGTEEGRKEGMRNYHALCFFEPRIMIDHENGFTVGCGPMGKIPKEELENYKDGV